VTTNRPHREYPNLGIMAEPAALNALLTTRWAGRAGWSEEVAVHPDAFKCVPVGCRILVALDPVPEDYKGIKLPDSYRSAEQPGIGTIMGVGLDSFSGSAPYPGAPIAWVNDEPSDPSLGYRDPTTMLYHTILMGQHAGCPLRLDFVRDRDYWGGVIVLNDRDIWCVLGEE